MHGIVWWGDGLITQSLIFLFEDLSGIYPDRVCIESKDLKCMPCFAQSQDECEEFVYH